MERINHLIDKWGYEREVIMPQYNQQYSDASGNINILDSIIQGGGSSPQILPCEFKYGRILDIYLQMKHVICTLIPHSLCTDHFEP